MNRLPETLSTREEHYQGETPSHNPPKEVGFFSLDSKRRFLNDSSQMRYYAEPDEHPNFDLRDGYPERYIKWDDSVDEKLDHILRWILANRQVLDVDFVTVRGHLTKLLTTPYDKPGGWLLAVTKFKGILYISEVETDAARQDREKCTGWHHEMVYCGHKFEQYMCADTIDGDPDSTGEVNINEGFFTVIQTRLSDHRLLFSGEVDCRDKDPHAPAPPACYVELKTSAEICTPKQRSNFHRFKLPKWWAQSFLSGVPRIVAGFRDNKGVVVSVKTFHLAEIPQLVTAEDKDNSWRPTVCMNFCSEFLSFVKRVVTEDNPNVVYLFCRNPYGDVTYSVHRDSPHSFLPNWYQDKMG
ncbi:decapping and exoribonuclease protein-like [Stigmatopora argus]